MRKIFILIILIISGCTSQKQAKDKSTFGIVIHGGAGTILKKNMTEETEKMYLRQLEEAVQIGFQIIKNDGDGREAVEKTINYLENSPLFNAGKGSVLTSEGTAEQLKLAGACTW